MRHPIHPALVHFPIACWTLAVAGDFASLAYPSLYVMAQGLMAIGCVMALLAIMVGMMEMMQVPEGEALQTSYWHMGLMLLATTLFTARCLIAYKQGLNAAALWLLALDSVAWLSLFIGAYFGGKLVYGYGVGR